MEDLEKSLQQEIEIFAQKEQGVMRGYINRIQELEDMQNRIKRLRMERSRKPEDRDTTFLFSEGIDTGYQIMYWSLKWMGGKLGEHFFLVESQNKHIDTKIKALEAEIPQVIKELALSREDLRSFFKEGSNEE